jgi:hypothetical protein
MGDEDPPGEVMRAIEIPKGECPPRSGSVQRDCIRQAGIGLGEDDGAPRPAGYNLLHYSPLIEPDGPISGIRLSDKSSRLRPRKALGSSGQADQSQHIVQVLIGKS